MVEESRCIYVHVLVTISRYFLQIGTIIMSLMSVTIISLLLSATTTAFQLQTVTNRVHQPHRTLQASLSDVGKPTPTKWEFDNFMKSNAVLKTNRNDAAWVEQRQRPRRNRKSAGIRGMVRENIVTPKDFIYPLFIHENDYQQEISSMPGCFRHSLTTMMLEVEEAMKYGIVSFVLFPKVPDNLKVT